MNKTSQPGTFTYEPIKEPAYKRPFDLAVLIVAHLALAPLWIALWIIIPLAIKLDDRGPVFYTQRRLGLNGKAFTVRKFRSMVVDAESRTGAVWASKNDSRITRVGRILRHTALDELPQVINVWAGDMSLVGPRPERPELHVKFAKTAPEFVNRLLVRPGMAGMAQVYGEYDLAPPHKLNYDIAYIGSMSLFLDIKLLTLAVFNTLLGRWGHATGKTTAPTASNIIPFTLAETGERDSYSADSQAENVEKAA